MVSLFTELAVVMVVSFLVAFGMNKLKQPLLVGYIFTGVIVGPIFFNLLSNPESYEAFSHIGVAFLLFIVGLQLNPKLIKEVGKLSLVTGLGQIVFTTVFGLLFNRLLGLEWIPAILIAVAITFSSTIIIVKLLSDTHGLEQLYGKISLGFLLVQDFVAVLLLMVVGTFSTGNNQWEQILQTVLIGLGVGALVWIAGKYALRNVLKYVSKNKELLFLFILGWCFGLAVLFDSIGFSLEIGALLAGVVLASTPYQQDISGRIKPLRDFFIILFFIFLGAQLIPQPEFAIAPGAELWYVGESLGPLLPQATLLSLFVLIGNPLIVLILVTRLGYSARTGFLSGLTVSQISEFSIILVLLGQNANLLTKDHVSLVTLIAIITITCSTYLVVYGEKIYARFKKVFEKLEKKKVKDSLQGIQGRKHNIGIFGFHRIGPHALRAIQKTGISYIVVDHNPTVVEQLKSKEVPVVFGDAGNSEFLSEFDFKDMNFVISTITNAEASRALLENYRIKNPNGTIVLTADDKESAVELYDLGADYVIVPHHLGGTHIETLIHEFSHDESRFKLERIRHLGEIYDNKHLH